MTSVRELSRQINGVAPTWSNITIINRGIPFYSDPLLKGTSRFSKKTGNNIGTISSDVTFELAEEALNKSRTLVPVGVVPSWVAVGSVLNIGPDIELQEVDDVINNTIIVKKDLSVTHAKGSTVELHGVQILAETAAAQNVTTMSIRTHHEVMEGDRIAIPALDNVGNILAESLFEVEISTAVQTSDDGPNSFLRFVYLVTFKAGVSRAISAGNTLFHRAYPAYFSKLVRVSLTSASLSDLGPFLVDNLSGRLKEGTRVEEHLTMLRYDAAQNLIGTTTPVSGSKNFPIVEADVPADVLLFWDLLRGSMQYTDFESVGVTNADGEWGVSQKIVPTFPPGTKWNIRVTSSISTKITVQMGTTNTLQVFDVPAAITTILNVGTDISDDPVDYIRFTGYSGQPGTTISFDTWELANKIAVAFIEYQLSGIENTEALWQSTGIIFKPYFTSIESLKMAYDSGQKYNAAGIYF